MPYPPDLDPPAATASGGATVSIDWGSALPQLHGSMVTLRELQAGDEASLLAMLAADDVSRFISPPPVTVEGFQRFMAWTHRRRADGRCISWAVVPRDHGIAVGLFQVRALEQSFATAELEQSFAAAEWGFAIGSSYWGSGVFVDSAKLVLDFSFDIIGVQRLEARASLRNGRGNGALRKLGAIQEGVLRRSFLRSGERHDQALWAILRDDWRHAKAVWGPDVIH